MLADPSACSEFVEPAPLGAEWRDEALVLRQAAGEHVAIQWPRLWLRPMVWPARDRVTTRALLVVGLAAVALVLSLEMCREIDGQKVGGLMGLRED